MSIDANSPLNGNTSFLLQRASCSESEAQAIAKAVCGGLSITRGQILAILENDTARLQMVATNIRGIILPESFQNMTDEQIDQMIMRLGGPSVVSELYRIMLAAESGKEGNAA